MKKFLIIASVLVVIGIGVYTSTRVFGDTFVGISLFGRGTSLDSGLVGHWTFDGGDMISNIADMSGTGNDGALVLGATGNTATTTVTGKIGQALVLDGVSDYVTVLDDNSLDNGTGNFTYTLWVKASNANQYATLLSKRMASTPFTQTNFTICTIDASGTCTASKKISGIIYQNSFSTAYFFYTTNDVIDGNWHMISLVRDGALSAKIYVDGVAQSITTPRAAGNPNVTNNQPLVIGNDQSGHYLNGSVDDVRVYNRALTGDEIARLYALSVGAKADVTQSGGTLGAGEFSGLVGHWTFDGKDMISNVADVSGNGNNGALSLGSSATTTAIGKIGQALSFDGTDDFVELGRVLLNITIPVSISMWVKPDASAGIQTLFHSNTPNTDCCNYRGVWLNLDAGNTISVNYGSGTGNASSGRRSKQSATTLTDGAWTHVVAVVRGATDMTIYFNGADAGGSYSGTGGALAVVDDPAWSARIGWNEQGPVVHYDGLLDDVRFYDRALLPGEVERLYQMGR